ncbi:MAG: methanogenesis marker 2 protein [Methanobacteriaceae archaeon]|nr:methanogenesis marker 2 protein [Methanobacteriaceae archaeon]MDY2745347.1 methanogenesis marker 2 protein [Methanosphaera sp.]
MDFNEIIESIRTFKGVTRKHSIADVREKLKDIYNISGNVYLAFGDDAAAVDIGNDQLMLLATDGIWGSLMSVDPWWSGYCSVLVNVNDIAAMGGLPMGMTNVLSSSDSDITSQIMDGIKEGVKKFGVPMVGGHTHPDTPYNALDVAISGIVDKDAIIPSCGAKKDDNVIVAIDLDGQVYPGTDINWDTTSDKTPQYVQDQIKIMNTIGKKQLVHAGKDISNPGIVGTLGMLLEASNMGADIDMEKIPRADNIDWIQWFKMYPGSAFVLTAPEETTDEAIRLLNNSHINAECIGKVTDNHKLSMSYKNDKKTVFDFSSEIIMGFSEDK